MALIGGTHHGKCSYKESEISRNLDMRLIDEFEGR
jgi:hypothetical protein